MNPGDGQCNNLQILKTDIINIQINEVVALFHGGMDLLY